MTISVIIPTYNGAHKILNILRALDMQTIRVFEVIVVIDGSTDNTINLLKNRKFGFEKFKVIEQENRGRAAVRNRGAKEAKGELLVFFDDDMRPVPRCVEAHLCHHQKSRDSILVGSQLEDPDVMQTEIQKYKAFLSRKWAKPLEVQEGSLPKSALYLTAANFSIPQKIFNTLGGFDERLTDAEDFDLAVRAFLSEIPIFYCKDASSWHDDFITCTSYIKRQLEYKKAHAKLLSFKPELYAEFPHRQSKQIPLVKRWIFHFFKHRFWINQIEKEGMTAFMPQRLRYKLYDLIITSHFI